MEYPDGFGAFELVAGDFNRDGKSDLVSTGTYLMDSTISVFPGQGDGTFQPRVTYETGVSPSSLLVADFNGDGKQDLAMGTCGSSGSCVSTRSLLFGTAMARFKHIEILTWASSVRRWQSVISTTTVRPTSSQPPAVLWASFWAMGMALFAASFAIFHWRRCPVSHRRGFRREYGKLDLVISRDDLGSMTLLLGNGDGSFRRDNDYVGSSIHPAAVGDFNADGKRDLVFAGGIGAQFAPVLLNRASMTTFALLVAKGGTGTGTVTINPGMDCLYAKLFAEISSGSRDNPDRPFGPDFQFERLERRRVLRNRHMHCDADLRSNDHRHLRLNSRFLSFSI